MREERQLRRDEIISHLLNKELNLVYQWMVWDYPELAETNAWNGCRVKKEDGYLMLYDAAGELKVKAPLEGLMSDLKPGIIKLAWFDEEDEKIYHSLDIFLNIFV